MPNIAMVGTPIVARKSTAAHSQMAAPDVVRTVEAAAHEEWVSPSDRMTADSFANHRWISNRVKTAEFPRCYRCWPAIVWRHQTPRRSSAVRTALGPVAASGFLDAVCSPESTDRATTDARDDGGGLGRRRCRRLAAVD